MSMGYLLIVVIGYELVNYLLLYTSARCVTFKELFKYKSTNKTGDSVAISLLFFTLIWLFRKSDFISSAHHRQNKF